MMLSVVMGIMLSVFSLLLEEFTVKRYEKPSDVVKLFMMTVIENLGYRQLNSYWRIKGLINFALKRKEGWGTIKRESFETN